MYFLLLVKLSLFLCVRIYLSSLCVDLSTFWTLRSHLYIFYHMYSFKLVQLLYINGKTLLIGRFLRRWWSVRNAFSINQPTHAATPPWKAVRQPCLVLTGKVYNNLQILLVVKNLRSENDGFDTILPVYLPFSSSMNFVFHSIVILFQRRCFVLWEKEMGDRIKWFLGLALLAG